MIFVSLFPTTEKETSYMLKWWRMPLYAGWINAENLIIWLVTFQIQIFKFKTASTPSYHFVFLLLCFAAFCCKRYFLNSSTFFVLCFHSRWRFRFSRFLVSGKRVWRGTLLFLEKSQKTLAENNFGERKFSCTRLNFGEILFAGTKWTVSGGQYCSILPARVANQNTEFATYCPLTELAM